MPPSPLQIAVFPGDGIGPEVIAPTIEVLKILESRLGGFRLDFKEYAAARSFTARQVRKNR